jgi:hypothetical protein
VNFRSATDADSYDARVRLMAALKASELTLPSVEGATVAAEEHGALILHAGGVPLPQLGDSPLFALLLLAVH